MPEEIALDHPRDWNALREQGLTTVVDPMVYRAAELFLAGSSGVSGVGGTWDSLSQNIGGLAAFFDAIILNDRLPIFDYSITFPEVLAVGAGGMSARLVDAVNVGDPVLTPIRIGEDAYRPLKQAALAELNEQPYLDPSLQASLLAELAAFDYRWSPELPGDELRTEDERRLSSFLYGGALFGAYAQMLHGTHLLQPKRARVLGQVALGTCADDAELYARIAQLPDVAPDAVSSAVEVPPLPSFLPYLLEQKPETPTGLLEKALELRGDPDIGAYRTWRAEVLELVSIGGSPVAQKAEFAEIEAVVKRRLTPRSTGKLKLSLVALAVPVIEYSAETDVRPRAAWGWSARRIGGDHRKVLMRLVGGRAAFARLDLVLGQLWKRG